MTIGERIRKIRKSKKLTQREVARRCKMDEAQYRRYEIGQNNPKYQTIERIAEALEVAPGDLLGGSYSPSHMIDILSENISSDTDISESIKLAAKTKGDYSTTAYKWLDSSDAILLLLRDLYTEIKEIPISENESYYEIGTGKKKFLLDKKGLETLADSLLGILPPLVSTVKNPDSLKNIENAE